MKRLATTVVLAIGALLVVGIVAAHGGSSTPAANVVSPKELSAAGWLCLDPGYWVHCTPPGINIGKAPPVIVSLNFYTKDPEAPSARFLGFEDLIRADIWNKLRRHWPCGTNGKYRRVPGDSLPKPGYMYCHRFNDKLPLPKR
jgi:hypothetical protein